MPDLVNSGSITLADGTSGVNPPAGSYLDIGVEDHPAVSIDLEGAFTATLVIEAMLKEQIALERQGMRFYQPAPKPFEKVESLHGKDL